MLELLSCPKRWRQTYADADVDAHADAHVHDRTKLLSRATMQRSAVSYPISDQVEVFDILIRRLRGRGFGIWKTLS